MDTWVTDCRIMVKINHSRISQVYTISGLQALIQVREIEQSKLVTKQML